MIKLSEENIRENLRGLGFGREFLGRPPEARSIKEKGNKMGFFMF